MVCPKFVLRFMQTSGHPLKFIYLFSNLLFANLKYGLFVRFGGKRQISLTWLTVGGI